MKVLRAKHGDKGEIDHAPRGDGLDYTLCGIGSEGQDDIDPYREVEGRINCSHCMDMIRHCKSIRVKYDCAKVEL